MKNNTASGLLIDLLDTKEAYIRNDCMSVLGKMKCEKAPEKHRGKLYLIMIDKCFSYLIGLTYSKFIIFIQATKF